MIRIRRIRRFGFLKLQKHFEPCDISIPLGGWMPANLYVGLGKEFNSLFTCRSAFRVPRRRPIVVWLVSSSGFSRLPKLPLGSSIYWTVYQHGRTSYSFVPKSLPDRWNEILSDLWITREHIATFSWHFRIHSKKRMTDMPLPLGVPQKNLVNRPISGQLEINPELD